MFCGHCGSEIGLGLKFCVNCGQPAPAQSAPPATAEFTPTTPSATNMWDAMSAAAKPKAEEDYVRQAVIVSLAGLFCFPVGQLYGLMKVNSARELIRKTGKPPKGYTFLLWALIITTVIGLAQLVLVFRIMPAYMKSIIDMSNEILQQ